jgi:hypothetical protein
MMECYCEFGQFEVCPKHKIKPAFPEVTDSEFRDMLERKGRFNQEAARAILGVLEHNRVNRIALDERQRRLLKICMNFFEHMSGFVEAAEALLAIPDTYELAVEPTYK